MWQSVPSDQYRFPETYNSSQQIPLFVNLKSSFSSFNHSFCNIYCSFFCSLFQRLISHIFHNLTHFLDSFLFFFQIPCSFCHQLIIHIVCFGTVKIMHELSRILPAKGTISRYFAKINVNNSLLHASPGNIIYLITKGRPAQFFFINSLPFRYNVKVRKSQNRVRRRLT